MKIKDLTEKQMKILYKHQLSWVIDNRREWLFCHNPEFVSMCCPQWTRENYPHIEISRYADWDKELYRGKYRDTSEYEVPDYILQSLKRNIVKKNKKDFTKKKYFTIKELHKVCQEAIDKDMGDCPVYFDSCADTS